MASASSRLVIILAVVLLLVVAASAAVLFLVPDDGFSLPQLVPTETPVPDAPTGTEPTTFDVRVFQRQAYQQLNQQLVQEGRLPVAPPAPVGKANPFL